MSEGKPITDDESEELLRQYFLLVKEHNQFLKRNRRKIKKTIQKNNQKNMKKQKNKSNHPPIASKHRHALVSTRCFL